MPGSTLKICRSCSAHISVACKTCKHCGKKQEMKKAIKQSKEKINDKWVKNMKGGNNFCKLLNSANVLLDFEINCGHDDICVDDLRMDFNFSGHEDSSLHIHFTAQKNDSDKPVKQILKVENDFRELTFKVFIRVPVILGDKFIWTDKNFLIPDCVKQRDERPIVTDFVEVIKKDHVVNCSVAVCAVFSCDVNLIKNERKLYYISGNVSSGWIEQTGLRAAVFELVSSVSLDYDKSKYIFFSSDSQHTAPSLQINTQVEVYEEVNLTKEIIGGVIGGLAVLTAAFYKAGFFKSQYKQILQEAQRDAGREPTMTQ